MKASIKKYDNNLQSQKDFSSLLLPRIADLTESRITYKDTANKAGSLSDNSTTVGLRFLAELQRGLALFVYVLQLTFFQRMPRIEKVSAGAPGVPDATANARKRVESILKLSNEEIANTLSNLTHEQYESIAPFFRVVFCLIECWQGDKSSNPEKSKVL